MFHHVLGARGHPDAAFSAARLAAVGVDRGAFEIAPACHGNSHVLHLNQVFEADLAGVLDDLRAALIAVVLLDFLELLDDDAAQNFVRAEDLKILADLLLDFGKLLEDLLLLHARQTLELQLDDGLRLPFGELEPCNEAVLAARMSLITASRFSSAFLNPSRRCSRSRALRRR